MADFFIMHERSTANFVKAMAVGALAILMVALIEAWLLDQQALAMMHAIIGLFPTWVAWKIYSDTRKRRARRLGVILGGE